MGRAFCTQTKTTQESGKSHKKTAEEIELLYRLTQGFLRADR
jgi:hypothetical protein